MRSSTLVSGALLVLIIGCSVQASSFASPLPRADSRPTPLHFGLYVTPDSENNPIDPPERFTGYHVGLDYEIDPHEAEEVVDVFAICHGRVLYSGFAEGYGGLLVERCNLKGLPVTVLYGHLTIEGLPAVGTRLKKGQSIGILAPARSHDSGGNRKHLHLGIHRGAKMDIRGYVQSEAEMGSYIDPMTVLPRAIF